VREIARSTYTSWRSDRTTRLGAGLAYYALFGTVPLIAAAVGIAGLVFPEASIQSFLNDTIDQLAGGDIGPAASDIASLVAQETEKSGFAVVGALTVVITASFLVTALQDAFNVIWQIPVGKGLSYSFRRRLVAFGVVLLTGGLLTAALVVNTLLLVIDDLLPAQRRALSALQDVAFTAASWVFGVAALAVLFRVLVDRAMRWRNVLLAAVITAFSMALGAWGLSAYFRLFGSTSLSGVAGAILATLFWLYVEAQILLTGVQFLKTLETRNATANNGDTSIAL